VLCLTFLLPFYQVISKLSAHQHSAHQHCNKCIWYTFVLLSLHFHVQCTFFSFICVLLILFFNVFGWMYYEKIKNWMQCLRFFQFFWTLNFFVLRDDGVEDSMISTTILKDGIKSICRNDWRAIELKNFKTNGQQESQGEVRISLKY
jgi:hypothetical protein